MSPRSTSPAPPPAIAAWTPPPPEVVGARLVDHLTSWLGHWPPDAPVVVVSSPAREQPGWDGRPSSIAGVCSPEGTVLSVPPPVLRELGGPQVGESLGEVAGVVLPAVGLPRGRFFEAAFRWCDHPALLPEVGVWVPATDPRVPPWLRPFGGEVLAAFTPEGDYAAGLGLKRHDATCHELAVGTEEPYRGRRLARSLVAQAARRVLDEGRVPTYLHGLGNEASARVADAAGFPDRGWRIIGVVPG